MRQKVEMVTLFNSNSTGSSPMDKGQRTIYFVHKIKSYAVM